MIKVCSSLYSFSYGNEIRFPYSIAIIISYSRKHPLIRDNFIFEKTFLLREEIDEHIKHASNCDILLCSSYIWNYEINNYLASEVKKRNKNCLIIFGGPNVPNEINKYFFEEHPYIDILVHGEGELALQNILLNYYGGIGYRDIIGVETKDFNNGFSDKINDVNLIPSPYLTNLIWDLVDNKLDRNYLAPWETYRGCPFKCSFCDWGSSLYSQLRKFNLDRLEDEIRWFAKNKISYIDGCDSNYGFFNERDLALAKTIKEVRMETGYPLTFRPSWTKTTNETTIEIAKTLKSSGIFKATTLAVQSLHDETLENINRKNMAFSKYSEISSLFRKNNIPTYTEIIAGLPGETLDSFKKGLERIISETEVVTLYVYNCTLLENSEMNKEEYKNKYQIKYMKSPIYLTHSKVVEKSIPEYENIIIGTYSYTIEDLSEMFFCAWQVQTFYSFGIYDKIMEYLKRTFNIPYMNFLNEIISILENENDFIRQEILLVRQYIDAGYTGKGWEHFDLLLGDIYWSIEEASWLRLVKNIPQIRNTLSRAPVILCNKLNIPYIESEIEDLMKFQIFLLTKENETLEERFKYDWKKYFLEKDNLQTRDVSYSKSSKVNDHIENWNYETMWYGRSRGRYKTLVDELIEGTVEVAVHSKAD